MTPTLAWVLGRGGMLGSHVEAEMRLSGVDVWQPTAPVHWGDSAAATADLERLRRRFLSAGRDRNWQVLWCAGAGVTATTPAQLSEEVQVFADFIAGLASSEAGTGSLFLASSAGGVYAGANNPPFDENATPRALAPYGEAKLAMERLVAEWTQKSGGRALVGRLANLYGPGQDIRKPQGLISQLLRSHLQRRPLQIYVPLDTIRDYMYVGDASRLVVSAMSRLMDARRSGVVVKVIASWRGTTVGSVIGELHRVLRRRPPIVLGTSPITRLQARDLRLRSVKWADLDHAPITPFPVGIHATLMDLMQQQQRGSLVLPS